MENKCPLFKMYFKNNCIKQEYLSHVNMEHFISVKMALVYVLCSEQWLNLTVTPYLHPHFPFAFMLLNIHGGEMAY